MQITSFNNTWNVLSSDLKNEILKKLNTKELAALLLVSKVFWKIIKDSSLQINNPEFVADIYKRMELQPTLTLSMRVDFLCRLQKAVTFEIYTKEHVDDLIKCLTVFPNIDTVTLDFESTDNLEFSLNDLTSKIAGQKIANLQLQYIASSAENYDGIYEEMKALAKGLPTLKNLDLVITLRLRIDNSIFRLDNQLQNFIEHLNSFHLTLSEAEIKCKANYQIEVFIETTAVETIKEQIQELFYFPKEQANVCLLSPVNTLCKYLNPQDEAESLLEEFASLLGNVKEDMYWVDNLKLEYLTSYEEGYKNIYAQINKIVDHLPNLK